MARAAATDPFLNFRFHVLDPRGGNLDPVAGFTSCSLPEITQDPASYREGVMRWTQKYPGIANVGDITLTRGTVRRRTDFLDWVMRIVNGGPAMKEYRTDLQINEYHITDEWGITGHASRHMLCHEVFPTSVKPMADKEATSTDIAMQQMTLACENFDIVEG